MGSHESCGTVVGAIAVGGVAALSSTGLQVAGQVAERIEGGVEEKRQEETAAEAIASGIAEKGYCIIRNGIPKHLVVG